MSAARIVVVSAGVSDPSSTRMLADRLALSALDRLGDLGISGTLAPVDLGPLAVDIARALVAGFPGERIQAAIDELAGADAIIAATPVYKAGISGLFKSFVDLLDNDLLVAKPVLLAATAGTARHAMVADEQMRPLFAFLRALPVPTSVFAAPEEWGSPALGQRITRAATELAHFVRSGVGTTILDAAWGGYTHTFAGSASRAEHTVADVSFDTDLMRLATGGASYRPPQDHPTDATPHE